jgi:Lipopolysaccharide-assembly
VTGQRSGRDRRLAAVPFAALALFATACGYTFGSGLHRHGVRTVALEVVGNDSYRQRLEAELSSALARELPVSSDLELADRSRADAILQVVLTDVTERTLIAGLQNTPVGEGAFEGRVWARLVRRSGEVLLDRRILDRTEFRSPIGEDLGSARRELVEDLARKIALALSRAD